MMAYNVSVKLNISTQYESELHKNCYTITAYEYFITVNISTLNSVY
jgi:hypothetical protein